MDALEDVPVHSSGKLDRGVDLLIVQTIGLAASAVCVLIRAYVKCFIVRSNVLEDYLIYCAMVAYIVYSAVVIDGCYYGAVGKHPSLNFSLDQAARGLRTWYITMVLYPWITLTVRAAVCVLLFRLTQYTRRFFAWCIGAIFAASTLFSLGFFFVLLLQCAPPRYFWTKVYGDSGHCHDRAIVDYSTTVYSSLAVVFDWCLGLLPIALLWSVQMNRRTKVAIAGLLSLGVIAGMAIIVRTTYVTALVPGLRFLYEATDVAIWSVIEPALGMIASCAVTFRPFFKSCGLGWKSSKKHVPYPVRDQRKPRDPFVLPTETRDIETGLGPGVSRDDDKPNASEFELVEHQNS